MNEWIWLIVFIVLLLIEIATMGLTTIWFAGGALVAFVIGLFCENIVLQIAVFLIVSCVLLFLTRPIAVKYINKNTEKTNVDRLVGKEAIVIEKVDGLHGTGRAMVEGMEWSVKASESNVTYEKDEVVTIKEIQGVKLVVEKKLTTQE